MKIFIIDDDYPSKENLYGDVFAHVRIKEYSKRHNCIVGSFKHKAPYVYEGITVKVFSNAISMRNFIQEYNPDIILVHFALKSFIDDVILKLTYRCIIWVHGYEALGWYRRLFNLTWRNFMPRSLYNMVKGNIAQLSSFRRLIAASNEGKPIEFVFVSNWMKNICEKDTFSKVNRYHIIPNPIDDKLFKPVLKEANLRMNILMIRPFDSKKYATDIAINAIKYLQKFDFFPQLKFHIYGRGQKFKQTTQPIANLSNVFLKEQFIPQVNIPSVHAEFGVFLCPTRQDAQGVSMCEAMSSGLIPITSHNTAIPEFVTHNLNGFLTNSSKEIANAIIFLFHNPDVFVSMSDAASKHIIEKAGIDHVIAQELTLIEN